MPTAKKPQSTRKSTKDSRPSGLRLAPLLLEIGTEELPSHFINPALQHLVGIAERFFKEHHLSHGTIQTMGTPRRLTLMVNEVASQQTPLTEEIFGPPKSIAFDSQGQPTQAAKGFANSQGIAVGALQVRETPKGPYICAIKPQSGRKTLEVLREELSGIIQRISFPKSMRWNPTRMRFARPLRWIVALYGNKVLPFEIAGVHSGTRTWGHRFLHQSRSNRAKGVEVQHPLSYVAMMRKIGVVVDPQERRSLIRTQLTSLTKSAKGQLYQEHVEELLEQAVFSVEYPQAILGRFDPKYLELPKEVLITAMKEHQGYFSLVDRDGTLLPRFIAVTNMKLLKMDLIHAGNERVLAARLNDAQYFFNEDRREKQIDRVAKLQEVIFHQKLGSLYQKTERIRSLATVIAEKAGRSDVKNACDRAAFLAKADLTTGMVGEFPSLQGIMGKEYATREGESQEICVALGEQYLPRTPDDALPQSPVGTFLSLAERCDTVTSFFRVGLMPSGSEDPFGLRRSAFGLVRIVVEKGLRLNLVNIIETANQLVADQGVREEKKGEGREGAAERSMGERVIDFISERLRYYGRTVHGIREDVMEAVLAVRRLDACDFVDLLARMQALQAMTTKSDFAPLIVGFKRAHRLVEKEQWARKGVQPDFFQHETEGTLFQAFNEAQQSVSRCMERQDYSSALVALLALKSPIDDFFVGVLVNTPDEMLRANRLSLLSAVDYLFLEVADFARLQVQGND